MGTDQATQVVIDELVGNAHGNLERVKEIAVEKGVTPSQVALAWVHAQGDDVVPIPGTKRRSYLEENVAAASIQLTGKELARLDEVFGPGVTAGDRYPDMSSVNA